MYYVCELHHAPYDLYLSDMVFDAFRSKEKIDEVSMRVVIMESNLKDKRLNILFLDKFLFDELKINSNATVLKLKDRVKEKNEINDRVLLNKIRKRIKPVCAFCFYDYLKATNNKILDYYNIKGSFFNSYLVD